MADEESTQGRDRIDVHDDGQLQAWAARLDTTADQIRDAVQAVGDRAADVELRLKGTRSTTNADQELRTEPGHGSGPD